MRTPAYMAICGALLISHTLIATASAAEKQPTPSAQESQPPTWLEAVRAQRQARLELWKKQTEQRREEMRNRMQQSPAYNPQTEQRIAQHNERIKIMDAQAETYRKDREQRRQEKEVRQAYPTPYGYSPTWYYRGY